MGLVEVHKPFLADEGFEPSILGVFSDLSETPDDWVDKRVGLLKNFKEFTIDGLEKKLKESCLLVEFSYPEKFAEHVRRLWDRLRIPWPEGKAPINKGARKGVLAQERRSLSLYSYFPFGLELDRDLRGRLPEVSIEGNRLKVSNYLLGLAVGQDGITPK